MSPAQLSYPEDQAIGIPGQLADSGPKNVLSRLAENSLVPFGRLLVLGTDTDKQALLPAQATDISNAKKVLGVSLHSHARESQKDAALNGYSHGESISILHKGRVYMEAEQAMTPESDVYIRFDSKKQEQTITWDIDFLASNTIDGKVNGLSITSVPFNTDQATTLANVATAIKNSSHDIDSATATGAREITIVSAVDKTVALSDFEVIGGASQAVDTILETVDSIPSTDRGKVRADDDGSTAAQLANARILKSASGPGELVVLELDL